MADSEAAHIAAVMSRPPRRHPCWRRGGRRSSGAMVVGVPSTHDRPHRTSHLSWEPRHRTGRPARHPRGSGSAFALFAHCFTCSKDIVAASRIATGLTDRGLRCAPVRLHRTRDRATATSPTPTSRRTLDDLRRGGAWLGPNTIAPRSCWSGTRSVARRCSRSPPTSPRCGRWRRSARRPTSTTSPTSSGRSLARSSVTESLRSSSPGGPSASVGSCSTTCGARRSTDRVATLRRAAPRRCTHRSTTRWRSTTRPGIYTAGPAPEELRRRSMVPTTSSRDRPTPRSPPA